MDARRADMITFIAMVAGIALAVSVDSAIGQVVVIIATMAFMAYIQDSKG